MNVCLRWLVAIFMVTTINLGFAQSAPLWTFTPDVNYPPTVSITAAGSAIVKYVVTNQSHRTHTLVMTPITGITQITTSGNCGSSFTLAYRQSCTLTLRVNGSALQNDIHDGPIVCQQGGTLLCFRPSANAVLNITRAPIAQYLVTPIAGAHGSISPSTPQTVVGGAV